MDKRIKEIASDLSKAVIQDYGGVYFLETAKELYDLGYRKIPEGAVVVSKQVWDEHIENWDKTTKAVEERVRKETAEKFAERLKEKAENRYLGSYMDLSSPEYIEKEDFLQIIDEICKELEGDNDG